MRDNSRLRPYLHGLVLSAAFFSFMQTSWAQTCVAVAINQIWQSMGLGTVAFDSTTSARVFAARGGETTGACAQGVRMILAANCLPYTQHASAYQYAQSLPQNGWTRVSPCNPRTAPHGTVLVYDRNHPPGNNGAGAQHGHIEIVNVHSNGRRTYDSDHNANRPGGSVPNNTLSCFTYRGPPTRNCTPR